jgi:outer membrane protein OmpA-like peptidoglycan-associated protein
MSIHPSLPSSFDAASPRRRKPGQARILAICAAALTLGVALSAQTTSPNSNKRKLGPEINTPEYREALPVVSADGSTLYFTREDQGQEFLKKTNGQASDALAEMEKSLAGLDPETRARVEATLRDVRASMRPPTEGLGFVHQSIWVSQRGPDGRWQQATRMPAPLSDDVATIWTGSVLPDNNTLLVAGMVNGSLVDRFQEIAAKADGAPPTTPNGFLEAMMRAENSLAQRMTGTASDTSQIFAWSTRTATGWGTPQPLRMRGFEHDHNRLEISLAPDGRHAFLAIRNRESNGEHDIYVSTLGDDGVWSKPEDLGSAVNSPGREGAPFMAPDGRTLYFFSNRQGGLGGYDFYITRRLDETWRKWAPAENMGPEVNSDQDDVSLTTDATGRLAFMAIGPLLKEDIYEFELPEALRPQPVAFVWGTVTDPSGAPLPAAVVYELLRTGEGAGQASARPGDGKYQIALPIGEDYAFRASAAGYVAISDRLDLTRARAEERFERNLVLVPLDVGKPIRLNNVFFDTSKTTLRPESTRELERLRALMNELPTLRIEVRGHTDSVDDDAFNQRLSEGRAAAVVEYLVTVGIAPDRLRSKGFGESAPVATNATDEGRSQNRRVEFVILAR